MAVHGELRPDDNALPLIVAATALNKADSAMTRPTGSVRIDNGDGTETWMGDAASENGGIVQWVGDTTPPAKPTGVTAECVAGTIVVSWDGTLAEPVPPDFSHVEVFARKDGDTVTVDVGRLSGAGSVTLPGYVEGTIVDVWAVAYDDAHAEDGSSSPNASEQSDMVTVIVEAIVSQQQMADTTSEILAGAKEYADKLTAQINTDMAAAKKTIDANTNAAAAAQKTADTANTTLKTLPDRILSQSKSYTDTLNRQTTDDLAAAKKTIDANTDAVKAVQKTADDMKTSLAQTAGKVESIDSSLASVKNTLDSTAATVTEQGSIIDQANRNIAVLQSRQTSVESVANGAKADAANAVKTAASATDTANTAAGVASAAARTAAEAKNGTVVKTVYEYAVSSSPTRKPGAYYTYAEGEPDNSVSVMRFQWATDVPDWVAGRYIWVRTRVMYGDGSESVTDPVPVTGNTGLPGPQGVQGVPGKDGADGKQGEAGVSVTGVTPYWATGLTAPAKPAVKTPGSPWQDTEPAYRYDAQTDLYKTSRVDFSDGSFQWTGVVTDSAYVAARDAENAARDAKDTATASKTLATTASSDASTAKQQAAKAVSTATDASTTAMNANTTATAARTAASSANMQATQAVGIANGKGDVLIQDTTPEPSMRKATTLWIDTTGGANTPKKWNGSTWAAVTDKTATDAASQAVKATSLANTAQATADSARVTAANAQAIGVKAQAAADGAQTTADSKNTVYTQQDEPSHTKLVPGDLWYQRNNYRTYAEGEPDNSVSVMEIPSSRIKGVKIWDGSEFVDYVFVADKVIAENSVTTGLLAADAIYGKVLKGGEFLTSNGRLTINDAGLVARDQSGNATLTVDADSGAVSMKGALTSGSTVTGATVTGGTVKAAQYELWNGSEHVASANSSGVYFGNSLSYAQSGGAWKLSLANTTLTAPSVSGGTVTGGTVQTSATANRGVKLTSGGLVAYDQAGNATMTVDANNGAVTMKGSLTSGSSINGATVKGGTVDADEYQLHAGSVLVGKANSSGVYFGDSLSYAQSGGVWKLSLKNALIQAPTINAGTLTGGTVQTTGDANKGVKLTSGGLVAYGSDGKPSFALNASDGSLSLNGAVMTNSTVSAATVNGGVITGANLNGVTITGGTIQTTGFSDKGVKLTSSGISAYDNNGVQTLHLNGVSNLISGTLRTAVPGTGSYMEIYNEQNVVDSSNRSSSNTGYIRSFDKYGAQTWQLMGWNYNGEYGGSANSGVELFVNSRCNIGLEYVGNATGIVKVEADRFVCNSTDFTPSMITDADTVMTLQDGNWTWYTGGDANPRTWQMRMGGIAFTHLEFQRTGSNVVSGYVAGRLNVHPTRGINVLGLHNNSPYALYIDKDGYVRCITDTDSGWFAIEFSYPVYVEPIASNTI